MSLEIRGDFMKRLVLGFMLVAICVLPTRGFAENCPNVILNKDDTYESLNSILRCLYSRIDTLEQKQRALSSGASSDRSGAASSELASTMQGMSKTSGPFTITVLRLSPGKGQVKVQFKVQNNGKDTSIGFINAALNDSRGQEFGFRRFHNSTAVPMKSKDGTDNIAYFTGKEPEEAGGDVANSYDVNITLNSSTERHARYSFAFYDVKPALAQ